MLTTQNLRRAHAFAEGLRIGIANETNLFVDLFGAESVQGRGGVRVVDTDPVVDGNPLEMVVSFAVETNWQFFRFGVVFNGIGPATRRPPCSPVKSAGW